MWIKLGALLFISSVMSGCGILWFRKGLSSVDEYDFKEDFKHTFLRPRWRYSGAMLDNKPRRIAPVMMILGGLGILLVGLVMTLSAH